MFLDPLFVENSKKTIKPLSKYEKFNGEDCYLFVISYFKQTD